MTIEEITQTLQTVAEQNAGQAARQQRLEETVQDVAALHQQVLRNHESRQQRMEESFQTLIELASATEGRLSTLEEGQIHTDARLDALIDAQIQLTQRVDTLTSDIAALNGHFDQMTARVDQVTENVDRLRAHSDALDRRFDKVADAIEALTTAQARTDDQIRLLLDRNGATKPRRKSTKVVKKKATKKTKGK